MTVEMVDDVATSRTIRNALVVGSTGFVGSWLVHRLVGAGVHVTGLARTAAGVGLGSRLKGPHTFHQIDIAEPHANDHFEGQDAVFFAAGSASVPFSVENPVADVSANTVNVVAALSRIQTMEHQPLFVHLSSAAVYGSGDGTLLAESAQSRPLSPYGVSKLAAEQYVTLFATEFGVPAFSVRPFSVYGPGQQKQVVFDLATRIVRGESPLRVLGDPSVSRDFVHVDDVAGALVHAAQHAPARGEVYNVGSGEETTIKTLAEALLAAAGSDASIEFSGSVRKGDPLKWQADIARLREIGYAPQTRFADGIVDTFRWVKELQESTLG